MHRPAPFRILTLALGLVLAACGREAREARPPVLVLGVDGMEWSVAEPLLEAGRMPNLARLLEDGVGGVLETEIPTRSPMLWTTVATGRQPEDHGILHFGMDPETGEPSERGVPYTSETRKVPALWNLAGDAGLSTALVGWWVTWPAEPVAGARIVSSYAAQAQGTLLWKGGVWADGLPELTWPRELQDEILPYLREGALDGPVKDEYVARFGLMPEKWHRLVDTEGLFRFAWHADRTHERIFVHLLEQEMPDLAMVYFGTPDVAGHFWWRYREPDAYHYRIRPREIRFFGEHIDKTYEALDDWIGEILAVTPPETTVLLVSDHGMRAYNLDGTEGTRSGGHKEGEPGVFVLSGPSVTDRGLLPPEERRLGHLLDVAPTVCDLLGMPALEEMPGHSLRGLMTDGWRAAHPEPERVPTPDFRPPLPPRAPTEDASELFRENLTRGLGYTD